MRGFAVFLFMLIVSLLSAQEPVTDRLIKEELKMSFPSIYFKHGTTDYADMPYTADSCFRYLALRFKECINSLVIWRDSLETEKLSAERVAKLKAGIKKYLPSERINIRSMGPLQKISRQTISYAQDSTAIRYLLSLNSVFDISKTRVGILPENKKGKKGHIDHPRLWCVNCWRNHRFSTEYRKLHVNKRKS